MQITIETITPEIAKRYLLMNTGNFRSPDQSRVERYAKDMVRGVWDLTGDTIKFNGCILLDGQHRGQALAQLLHLEGDGPGDGK